MFVDSRYFKIFLSELIHINCCIVLHTVYITQDKFFFFRSIGGYSQYSIFNCLHCLERYVKVFQE